MKLGHGAQQAGFCCQTNTLLGVALYLLSNVMKLQV